MKTPFVSVVVPTYNRAQTLPRAIESVLKQSFADWELVIVDDGSSDNTEAVVKGYDDPRIRYFKQANGGPSRARNHGIAQSKGSWVMYLDSDDELLPPCIETMVAWAAKHPQTVFAFPRSERTLELWENGKLVKTVDDSADTPPQFTIHDIFDRKAGLSPNGFMHVRKIYDEGIRWDEDLALMEDWEFMMSIGEKYPDGFLYVPVVLQKYTQRFGGDNLVSQTQYSAWADAFDYIYNRHKSDKMLKGQTWHPAKADKWRQRQKEFEAGMRPAYAYHYFQK